MEDAVLRRVVNGLSRIPIRHQGRDRSGVDCVGAVALIYAGVGIHVPLPSNYALRWFEREPRRMLDYADDTLGWTRVREARPRDLLIFAWHTTLGDHPGVYVGGGLFGHAYAGSVRLTGVNDRGPLGRWVDACRAIYRPGRAGACRKKHSPEDLPSALDSLPDSSPAAATSA